MADWKSHSVGSLCDSGLVELQTGPFGTQLHAHDYVADGIPVVPTEAIRGRRIDRSVLPMISNQKATELERHKLKAGDILFARRGVQATGHIGYVRDDETGFICGTGAIRLRVAENNSAVSSEFLSHVFANPASIEWFKFHAIGATMPNLNEGIIRSFTFLSPPLYEQKAIALLLSALDDKIALNRRMSETLEELARAIFKDWFIDFGPTRARLERRAPSLAEDIWALFADTFDDEDKPHGWSTSTVGTEFLLIMGQSPPGDTYNESGEGMPFFQGRRDFGFRYPSRRVYCTAPARIANQDDTLVSVRAPVGDLNMAWEKCCIGRGVAAARHRSGARGYTFYSLSSIRADLSAYERTGTVFGAINKLQFEALRIIAPPSPIVAAFESAAAPLDARIRDNEIESAALTATRNLLLPRLMSGEVRLKDAEKMVEATL